MANFKSYILLLFSAVSLLGCTAPPVKKVNISTPISLSSKSETRSVAIKKVVAKIPRGKMIGQVTGGALCVWLEKEGGYQAIYQYLINHQVTQDIRKVPVTREKEMAMDMSCNPVVTEIKDYLEDNDKYWCFNIECFEAIFDKHRVNSNQRKHLLVEAGLVKDNGRHRINSNRYRLWVREGVYTKGIGSATAAFYNGRDDLLNEVTLISHSGYH